MRYQKPTLYLTGDTLYVDIRMDSLFTRRSQDAIASGMTTSISHEIELESRDTRKIRQIISLRLDHDIWEGRYRITRQGASPDTLVTDQFTEAEVYASTLNQFPIATLPDVEAPFLLRIRSAVNPISPEQEAKTRKWLNLLERGSVLELFFSLAPTDQQGSWIELARFRKSDLPTEVPSPLPEDETSEP